MSDGAMTQSFFIRGQMPGLNELLKARGLDERQPRRKRNRHMHDDRMPRGYRKLKADWELDIFYLVRQAKLVPVERARFVFVWLEPNTRRDLDNVAAGGRKLILDALVKSKILPDDSSAHVVSFRDEFHVDPHQPGVIVILISIEGGR